MATGDSQTHQRLKEQVFLWRMTAVDMITRYGLGNLHYLATPPCCSITARSPLASGVYSKFTEDFPIGLWDSSRHHLSTMTKHP